LVMIVEDVAFTRMVLRKLVESTGLEDVVEAENGEEAVHKFKVFRPDIVTMDIQLPGMNGIVAVKKIKEMDPHANIIICSAIGRREDIIRAIHAGADAWDESYRPYPGRSAWYAYYCWQPPP
jgi:two-component system chemotaxis response regulator CheY